ncbi:MAG TPA: hypothetical protein VH640_01295 [Bryobacteraceae bacterium]
MVAYNRMVNWHDGIDVATYGTPDGAPNDIPDRVPLAIDFYGNDIQNMGDNCFETDGGARNIRVFRNRCFDSAAGALSVQPMFGGPVYCYQNLVYNAPTGSLKYIEGSSGILIYNNTIIGEGRAGPTSNQQYRNNLILAQGAFDPVFAVTTYTNYSSSDYNGFRPNPDKADSFEWNSPAFGVVCRFRSKSGAAPVSDPSGVSGSNRPGAAQRVDRLQCLRARSHAGSDRSATRLYTRRIRFQPTLGFTCD